MIIILASLSTAAGKVHAGQGRDPAISSFQALAGTLACAAVSDWNATSEARGWRHASRYPGKEHGTRNIGQRIGKRLAKVCEREGLVYPHSPADQVVWRDFDDQPGIGICLALQGEAASRKLADQPPQRYLCKAASVIEDTGELTDPGEVRAPASLLLCPRSRSPLQVPPFVLHHR